MISAGEDIKVGLAIAGASDPVGRSADTAASVEDLVRDDRLLSLDPNVGYVQVRQGNDIETIFNVPGVFGSNGREEVCIESDEGLYCSDEDGIGDESSPLLPLRGSSDGETIASVLGGDGENSGLSRAAQDAYADYYLLYKAASGQIELSHEQLIFLRLRAVSIWKKWKADFSISFPGTGNPLNPLGLKSDPLLQITTGGESPFSAVPSADYLTSLGLAQYSDGAPRSLGDRFPALKEAADGEMRKVLFSDPAQLVAFGTVVAKRRLIDAITNESKGSYFDHSMEIQALWDIEDPKDLADAIDLIEKRVEKGKKLAVLYKAAGEAGGLATVGGRTINLYERIRELSRIEDEAAFRKGILDFRKDFEVVLLANGIDESIRMVEGIEGSIDGITFGNPHEPDLYMEMACVTSPLVALNIAGRDNKEEYRAHFADLKIDLRAARDLLDAGNPEGARKKFREIFSQERFKKIVERIQDDLTLTSGVKFGGKIAIIIAAAFVANIAGTWVGAAFAAEGAPAWLVGAASLFTEAGAFLATDKALNFAAFGELPFDPHAGVAGNAGRLCWEWAETAAMFKFLRWGMNAYNKLVRNIVVARSINSLLKEGVITEAQLVGMSPEVAQKIAARAELGVTGKILNYGGLFSTEYVVFTVWDYLRGTLDTTINEGEFTLPKDFFTGGAFAERFIFLACLKAGGALASPFTRPLQARAAAALMERYGPQLKAYEAEYNGLMERLAEYEKGNRRDSNELESILDGMIRLLERRQGLEDALAKADPELVLNRQLTSAVLGNVRKMRERRPLLDAMERGKYDASEAPRLLSILDEGRRNGDLDYEMRPNGDIRVTLTAEGEIREISIQRVEPDAEVKPASAPVESASQPLPPPSPAVVQRPMATGLLSAAFVRALLPTDVRGRCGNEKKLSMDAGNAVRYADDVYQYADEGGGLNGFLDGKRTNLRNLLRSGQKGGKRGDIHIVYRGVTEADVEAAQRFTKVNGVGLRIYDPLNGKVVSIPAESAPASEPLRQGTVSESRGLYLSSVEDESATVQIMDAGNVHPDIEVYLGMAKAQGIKRINIEIAEGEPGRALLDIFERSGVDVEARWVDSRGHVQRWGTSSAPASLPDSTIPGSEMTYDVRQKMRGDWVTEDKIGQVNEYLAGRDLDSLTEDQKMLMAKFLIRARGWSKDDIINLLGTDVLERARTDGLDVPLGVTRSQWEAIQREFFYRLHAIGFKTFNRAFIQGSSVTGVKSEGGAPFRDEMVPGLAGKGGKRSDLDIGVEVTPEGFALMLVDSVQSAMAARGVSADFNAALAGTLKWVDAVEADLARARREGSSGKPDSSLDALDAAIRMVRPILDGLAAEYGVRSDETTCPDGMEWWQDLRNGNVKPTEHASFLEKALRDLKIPYFLTGSKVRETIWGFHQGVLGMGVDRPIDISFMLPEARIFPEEGKLLEMSAGLMVSPQ